MKRKEAKVPYHEFADGSDEHEDEDADIDDEMIDNILKNLENSRLSTPFDSPVTSLGIEDIGRFVTHFAPWIQPFIDGITSSIRRNPQVFVFITFNIILIIYIFSFGMK